MKAIVTVPEPSFPSLFTSIPFGQIRAELRYLVIDESDHKRIFRLAPFDEEYFITSILLMNLERLGLLKVENYRELYYKSLRKKGKRATNNFISLLQRDEEMLLRLASNVWRSWTQYARNDIRKEILQKIGSRSMNFFEESKKAAYRALNTIQHGKIDDTIEQTIQKVISKTIASHFIIREYAGKYKLHNVSITDSEEYNYVAESLSSMLGKNMVENELRYDLKTLTNNFTCLDSNFVQMHQSIYSLIAKLAPDIGIDMGIIPPYYLGTSIAYLFNFNLNDVIDDLKNSRPDEVKQEVKKVLDQLDTRRFILRTPRKFKYLAEYVVEEIPLPAPGHQLLKPIRYVLEEWMRQNSLDIQISKLRSCSYDGILFAAISFLSDPFYQINKHKILYSIWKWYRKVFYKPKDDDMKWYTTQRTFEKWTKATRWYETT